MHHHRRAPGKQALAVTSAALILVCPVLSRHQTESYFQQRVKPLVLPNQVQEQIDREIMFLEQIKPNLASVSSDLQKDDRDSPISNEALSNLAFLDLSIDEKDNLQAKYRAMGQETNEINKDEDSKVPLKPEIVQPLKDPTFVQPALRQDPTAQQVVEEALEDKAELVKIVEEVEEERMEDAKAKQYDELLDEDETAELEELIRWMSIQQTAILACLAALAIATIIMCAYRSCRSRFSQSNSTSDPVSILAQADKDSTKAVLMMHPDSQQTHTAKQLSQSPLTFRNLLKRKNEQNTTADSSPSETNSLKSSHQSSMNRQKDYNYSSDTPSFHLLKQ